jgi:hypothetical protein
MQQLSRNLIIELAKETSKRLGKNPLSRRLFSVETGINSYNIYSFFPVGGWPEVCDKAGLIQNKAHHKFSEEAMMKEFHKVVTEMGKIPSWEQLKNKTAVSKGTFIRRFVGKKALIEKYKQWLMLNEPAFGILPLLDMEPGKKHLKRDGNEYGDPLKFRGLLHAPTNEQGVVVLFGMVCRELGFIIESMHQSFPDCEAKMCIDRKLGRWKKLMIEFEYRSRNFIDHGHDPAKCDLIVCWENNWDDCPIDVLELKTEIGKLRNTTN